jgi:hypothetical protein
MARSILFFVSLFAVQANAQTQLVDLNTTRSGSDPRELTVIGDRLFFTADGPGFGREVHAWTEAEGAKLSSICHISLLGEA